MIIPKRDKPGNFTLILAHPRSASNTMSFIVSAFLEGQMHLEPFADEKVSCNADISSIVRRARKNRVGIKHCLLGRWPYIKFGELTFEESESYNKTLIRSCDKIIFLHRLNHLHTALSLEIAAQLQNWTTGICYQDNKFVLNGNLIKEVADVLEPADEDKISIYIRRLKEHAEKYRGYLNKFGNENWIEITYEDLIANNEKSLDILSKLLGKDIPNKAYAYLMPNVKTNNKDTVSLLPNIENIYKKYPEYVKY